MDEITVYIIGLVIGLGVSVGLAFIPANMARKKGYSYGGFWCLSFFLSFLIAIIIAACLTDKNAAVTAQGNNLRQADFTGYCTQCGCGLYDNDKFCPRCGAPSKQPDTGI